MGRRLNARCADLLEVFCDNDLNPIFKYKVDFLHRTVREFLLKPDIQQLLARRVKLPFDVRAYLCRALLAQIKLIASLMPNYDMNVLDLDDNQFYSFTELLKLLSRMIETVLGHVHLIETSQARTESSTLDEIELVVLTRNKLPLNSSSTELEIQYCRVLGLDCFNEQGWLLGKAIMNDLAIYVKQKIESNPRYSKKVYARPPLHYTMRATPTNLDMVRLLIQHGASPNQECAGITSWSQLLSALQPVAEKHSADAKSDWSELIGVMIGAGAKPNPKPFDKKGATMAAINAVCTPSDAARFSRLLEQNRTSKRSGRLGISKWVQQLKGTSAHKARTECNVPVVSRVLGSRAFGEGLVSFVHGVV